MSSRPCTWRPVRGRWLILVIVYALASLLMPGLALAHAAVGAQSRVWAFDLQGQVHVAGQRALTLDLHQGCGLAEHDSASGALLAARGEVRFAQRGVSWTFRHGESAGRTIEDVAAGLGSGTTNPSQMPIQTITRDGVA